MANAQIYVLAVPPAASVTNHEIIYCLGSPLRDWGEARLPWESDISHVLRCPAWRNTSINFAFLPSWWPVSMKRDLVSLWLPACERLLQIQLQASFQVIHSQQDPGGTPCAEQAGTPTGWDFTTWSHPLPKRG